MIDTVNVEELQAIASGATKKTININRKQKETRHISEMALTLGNWYQHINWINTTLVVIVPAIGLMSVPFVHLGWNTFWWSVTYYFITGMGITGGYHRMWAHRAYSGSLPLRVFYALAGGGAGQGSVKWWSNGHRTHHRYTDTERDPYNALRGMFHAHMGWMVFKQNPKLKGRTDISDLLNDPVVVWQHKNYLSVLLAMGFLFPAVVAGVCWGDFWGGLLYGGVLRLFAVHQSTFCVNSLAHYLGEQPFDDRHSPRDNIVTALLTFGEGYHNFHHQFPSDYRNAIKWYQYDPTKILIWACSLLGLARNLQTFSENAIQQGKVQQAQKKLDQWRSRLDWGTPIEQLPVIEYDDFKAECDAGKKLVLIAGIVHDVASFIETHPGGQVLIRSGVGKDATAVFNGGVYDHSNAAHNLLSTMRVGVIRGGSNVEIWRRAQSEKKDVNLATDSVSGDRIVRANDQPTREAAASTGRAA